MMIPIGSCGACLGVAFIYERDAVRIGLVASPSESAGPAARTVRRNGPRDGLGVCAGRSLLSTPDAELGVRH
jgi:hypothetical protein